MWKKPLSLLLVLSFVVLGGCSLVTFEKRYYKPKYDPPVKGSLTFRSKEALAAGATLQNQKAAQIFYEGTKPRSKEAQILYDMSYRFMDLAGVNTAFDPTDPKSIEKVFKEADNALQEKDKIIHQLEVDTKKQLEELATNKEIIRDKEAELVSTTGKWKAQFDTLWTWIWGILIGAIVLLVGLGVAQVMTGIPFLTIFFGGVRLIFGAARQTIRGVEEVRKELKNQIANGGTEEEKENAKKMLKKLDTALEAHQDESVKKFITNIKMKHLQ